MMMSVMHSMVTMAPIRLTAIRQGFPSTWAVCSAVIQVTKVSAGLWPVVMRVAFSALHLTFQS